MKYLILGLLAMSSLHSSVENHNISHAERDTWTGALDKLTAKIKQRGDLPHVSAQRQLELLEELTHFEFGRFLIQTGGLNGYWIHYAVTYPEQGRLTGLNSENQPFGALESFLLNQAPYCLATQERFALFKQETQKRLHNGVSLASVPCGLMAELLDLDFSHISEYTLCGIDIDPESLKLSQDMAANRALADHCTFVQQDAWSLDSLDTFDVITSNGLTIYEPDNQKVVELYRQFFTALKPGGWLITSFLTPPPRPGVQTEWDQSKVNKEHALLQKILFFDILDCKWQVFRSEESVKSQLRQAGFSEIEILYDQGHIFPTVIAKKN